MLEAGTHQDYVREMEKSLAEGKVRRSEPGRDGSMARPATLHHHVRGDQAGESFYENEGCIKFRHEEC